MDSRLLPTLETSVSQRRAYQYRRILSTGMLSILQYNCIWLLRYITNRWRCSAMNTLKSCKHHTTDTKLTNLMAVEVRPIQAFDWRLQRYVQLWVHPAKTS